MSARRWIRIGIAVEDAGTYAVAVDHETQQRIAACGVPFEAWKLEGDVLQDPGRLWRQRAEDVATVLRALSHEGGLSPDHIVSISWSTSAGVNAALQARSTRVGLLNCRVSRTEEEEGETIALLSGYEAPVVRAALGSSGWESPTALLVLLRAWRARDVDGLVIESGEDRNETYAEWMLRECGRRLNLPLCSTSEFSPRADHATRLQAASALVTALGDLTRIGDLIHESVRRLGLRAPLFVVRNDGGLIPWHLFANRPTLGLLSGPVASLLGALHERQISNGLLIRIERETTSLAMIREGHAAEGEAELAGRRLPLPALKISSLPLGSESTVRFRRGTIASIGPWSAMRMGLIPVRYASARDLESARVVLLAPAPDCEEEIVALVASDGRRYAITLGDAPLCTETDALSPREHHEGVPSRSLDRLGCPEAAQKGLDRLAARLALSPNDVAELILERAAHALTNAIWRLVLLSPQESAIPLIGMGEWAPPFLPLLARRVGLPARLLEQSELLSALGAAVADLQETRERALSREEEMEALRREVEHAVVQFGASSATIRTRVRREPGTPWVKITARGRISPQAHAPSLSVTPDQRLAAAARRMALAEDHVELALETEAVEIYRGRVGRRRLLGFRSAPPRRLCLCDKAGTFFLLLDEAEIRTTTVGDALNTLQADFAQGGIHVAVYLISGARLVDLSGARSPDQFRQWIERALLGLPPDEPVFFICGREWRETD